LYTCELIELHRARNTPEDRFIGAQLERVAQLLRFTGATTQLEFEDRVEANEQGARTAAYDRGWDDGRRSLRLEITGSPYLHN
jgi:hypothetical protein